MKGYRTPSWFRSKVNLKQRQIKARRAKPKSSRVKRGNRKSAIR